jgi:hypothetical protein
MLKLFKVLGAAKKQEVGRRCIIVTKNTKYTKGQIQRALRKQNPSSKSRERSKNTKKGS